MAWNQLGITTRTFPIVSSKFNFEKRTLPYCQIRTLSYNLYFICNNGETCVNDELDCHPCFTGLLLNSNNLALLLIITLVVVFTTVHHLSYTVHDIFTILDLWYMTFLLYLGYIYLLHIQDSLSSPLIINYFISVDISPLLSLFTLTAVCNCGQNLAAQNKLL